VSVTSVRAQVAVDADGNITAGVLRGLAEHLAPSDAIEAEEPAPEITVAAGEGETVCEIEIPEELLTDEGVDIERLLTYRVTPGDPSRLTAK
jgi:hypothetical protein